LQLGRPFACRRSKHILSLTYLALALLGCGYVFVSMLLGHLHIGDGGQGDGAGGDGGDGPGDAGGDGVGGGHYGLDGDGHGAATSGGAGLAAFHFPFFSPLALSTIVGATGAYGLITKFGWQASDATSLLISIPAALVTAYAVTYLAWRIVMGSRGSSQIRLSDLKGVRGEVITPIPAHGIGEVAAMVQSERYNGPAREVDGREVSRGEIVIVEGMVGTTLVVRKTGH
jgi:membrane protein implicated in regulation of membrane protease activity